MYTQTLEVHNAVLDAEIAKKEARLNKKGLPVSKKLKELRAIKSIDWSTLDLKALENITAWALPEIDHGFGRISKPSFSLPKFYNAMHICLGMSNDDINQFFAKHSNGDK